MTTILICFVATWILIGALFIISRRHEELTPYRWLLTTYVDQAQDVHYITTCPRCQSTWEFADSSHEVNYCPTCKLRLEGLKIDE